MKLYPVFGNQKKDDTFGGKELKGSLSFQGYVKKDDCNITINNSKPKVTKLEYDKKHKIYTVYYK